MKIIDAERARGAAISGLSSRDLAIALNLMNERVMTATFAGDPTAIARQDVAGVLLELWLRAVYGVTDPGEVRARRISPGVADGQ